MLRTRNFIKLILSLALILISSAGFSQVHTMVLNQAPPLTINAGEDQSINSGEQVRLGGNPTASEGYGSYLYFWEPSTGLDDPNSANPMASPSATTVYQLSVRDGNNCHLIDEVTVEVKTSSIIEAEKPNKISIYPNPSSGLIHITFTNLRIPPMISVYSVLGEKVLQLEPQNMKMGIMELDLNSFKRGIYILSFRQGDELITKRILLK